MWYNCVDTNKEEQLMAKNRLKELRDRSRLTLQEVGMITGYSVPTISRHESGERGLTQEAMIKYASLYKVQTHELFVIDGLEDS